MNFKSIVDLNLKDKRVFIRADLNVPIDEFGLITDDSRIVASLQTIKHSIQQGALVMVTSHLGRPKEGFLNGDYSLETVGKRLSQLLNKRVSLITNWVDKPFEVRRNEVFLLENCRCNIGEKNNSDILVNKMAKLCDVYVNDAFGTAHRAEATTYGLALKAKEACAGFLMTTELHGLNKIYENPKKPVVAIVGGSKISTKLELLNSLLKKVDFLIVGGGIANTFLKAQGFEIGKSIVENNLLQVAIDLIEMSTVGNGKICVPIDVVVANSAKKGKKAREVNVKEVSKEEMILDIGIKSSKIFEDLILRANTIIWNGPVGLFEVKDFSVGTRNLALAVGNSSGFSAVGGGDTVSAVNKFGVSDNIDYISTGGGAFLEFLQGMELPAITSLTKNGEL